MPSAHRVARLPLGVGAPSIASRPRLDRVDARVVYPRALSATEIEAHATFPR